MRRQTINRIIFYITGLLILAMGLTLNTKAGLGVSPIISVSYSISQIMGMNFGNTTMGLYCVFVVVELILHFIRDRRSEKTEGAVLEHANRMNRKLVFLMDVLQIPLSMIFTRFLNLFAKVIPDFSEGEADGKQYAVRFAVLILALILTGIGAAMSLNMRIIPNPGDGIVQAIADCIHKSVGFTKNCFDVFEPYIIQILLSALILLFIKSLINKVIDFVCIGYSEKEIKHKKSIASKTVDFLSDLSDIIPKSKDK